LSNGRKMRVNHKSDNGKKSVQCQSSDRNAVSVAPSLNSKKKGSVAQPPTRSFTKANDSGEGRVPGEAVWKSPNFREKGPVSVTKNYTQSPLPHAPPTKGLSFKGPKDTRGEAIQRRLKKSSPWFSSISDPLHGADCKIPDETGVETGTLQIVHRGSIGAPSDLSKHAGVRVLSPYINRCEGATPGSAGGVNIQVTDTVGNIAWGNGTYSGYSEGFEFEGAGEFRTISNQHRIVSMGMYIQPEAALAFNGGEITLFCQPFAAEDSPNYVDYMNLYKSVTIPLNINKAAKVIWFPTSRQDWSFKSFIRTSGTVMSYDDDAATSVPFWNLGFLTQGISDSQTLRYTIVVNYEFIPKFNTLNVLGATPSPQDVTEVDLVESWVQDLPVGTIVPQKTAASSPSTVEPAHSENDEGTGFGMFFNVIKELAPLALALL